MILLSFLDAGDTNLRQRNKVMDGCVRMEVGKAPPRPVLGIGRGDIKSDCAVSLVEILYNRRRHMRGRRIRGARRIKPTHFK